MDSERSCEPIKVYYNSHCDMTNLMCVRVTGRQMVGVMTETANKCHILSVSPTETANNVID